MKPELNNTGIAVAGITTDYAGVIRSNPPDIGAYEFTLAPVVPADITVSGTVASGQTNCYNATDTITVAGTPLTFTVQSDGSATFIAGQKISFKPATTVAEGGYMHGYITLTNEYCTNPTPPMVSNLSQASGVSEVMPGMQEGQGVHVYPNPTAGNFTIETRGSGKSLITKVDIYSMSGGKIASENFDAMIKHEFSVPGLKPGMYFIQVISGDHAETVKLIKL